MSGAADLPGPPLDLLVVGAGPCGLSVGAAARRAGLSCLLVERDCLVSTIERYPLGTTFFSTPERLEIGDVPFVVGRDKPTRREALAYYRRVATHFGLDLRLFEEVVDADREPGGTFRVRTRTREGRERSLRARRLVLATGAFGRANLLDVPGEALDKVTHWFREPHRCFARDVLVVGGGSSAAEAALRAWRAGGRVTLAHLFEDFDDGVKPWILPDIRNRLDEGSIRALWRHRVEEIRPDRVTLRDLAGGAERTLPNDEVLAMTGYGPELGLLRELGVALDDDGAPAHDPASLETNVPGIHVAGVLVAGGDGGRLFIENGRDHGPRIARHLSGS